MSSGHCNFCEFILIQFLYCLSQYFFLSFFFFNFFNIFFLQSVSSFGVQKCSKIWPIHAGVFFLFLLFVLLLLQPRSVLQRNTKAVAIKNLCAETRHEEVAVEGFLCHGNRSLLTNRKSPSSFRVSKQGSQTLFFSLSLDVCVSLACCLEPSRFPSSRTSLTAFPPSTTVKKKTNTESIALGARERGRESVLA